MHGAATHRQVHDSLSIRTSVRMLEETVQDDDDSDCINEQLQVLTLHHAGSDGVRAQGGERSRSLRNMQLNL